MTDNFSNFLFLLIFAGLPLSVLLYFHKKTFLKNLLILVKVNIFSLIFWLVGGNISYQQNIWEVTYHSFLNTRFLGILIGDIFQSVIGTTLISFVTILLFEAYSKKRRFRDIFLQKE